MKFNILAKATVHIKIATLTLLPLICCVSCKKTEPQETKDVSTAVQSWDCGAECGTVMCELDTNKTLRVFGKGAMKDSGLDRLWDHLSDDCDITSVVIGDGVTTIGKRAFDGCYSLKSVTIPNSVISIGESAFHSSYSLKSVTIPNGVTSIGDGAFFHASGLSSVTISNSVTYIGFNAFRSYSGSVTISSSVVFIGNSAFNHTTSITVADNNSNYSSIDGVLFNKDKTKLIQYPINKKDSMYTIPNDVTTIGSNAFLNSAGLKSVTIPNSVTSIEDWAFACCDSLTSITIPNGVTSIDKKAFWHSWQLSSFISLNPVPPKINIMAFENINIEACLYVPAGSRAAYRAADVWKDFKCIKAVK